MKAAVEPLSAAVANLRDEVDSMRSEPLIDEYEAAERLGLAVPTLRQWRSRGRGPAFHKLGSSVRYAVADLEAWIEAQRRTPRPAKPKGAARG